MGNTYSATLITQHLAKTAITVLQNKFAPLSAFTRQVEVDPIKPKATVQVKLITAGSTTQTDGTNFESGDSTITNVQVAVHQITQSFAVSNSDLNSGLRLEDLGRVNAKAFASTIQQAVNAVITTGNFTATPLTSAPAAFGLSDLATLFGQLKKSDEKNLILDGSYFARIVNTPGFYQPTGTASGAGWKPFGWDYIGECSEWTGAGAGVQGFACHPQAIAVAMGEPAEEVNIPGNILSRETLMVEGLQIPVAFYQWFNPATRTMWCSFDLMFGASAADTTAGVIVKSS
jgi:hypothetical protein